jgi:hypothetical protein
MRIDAIYLPVGKKAKSRITAHNMPYTPGSWKERVQMITGSETLSKFNFYEKSKSSLQG